MEKDYVIFKNYVNKRYWEISGPVITTYMMYDIVSYEYINTMRLMLMLQKVSDIESVCETMIDYTNNNKEDIFIIEI
jgi:hypothetical protein